MGEQVIFATGNEGKMKEIRMILAGVDVEILSLKDAGISTDVEENGTTFAENALIKARDCARRTGMMVLADDSGLEIDCLDKEPGIHSARYLGENTAYETKNRILLSRLKDVPDEQRTARFVCVIAAVFPDGREFLAEGVMEGRIAHEAKGENGFGYDPIFYVPQYGLTGGELDAEQKNSISHRGKALNRMKDRLLSEGIWRLRSKKAAGENT